MRITTLIRKNIFLFYLLLCFVASIQCVYSQCPTVSNAAQSFCDTQTPTIASLQATDNGGGIKWYDTATSTTALSSSLSLQNGQDYFADDNTGTCGVRQSVVVTIYTAPTGANFQGVCVTSLSQAVQTNPQFNITGNNLQWYTTPSGGSALPLATILNDNTIYYISQTNPATGCQTSRLSLFVNVGLVPPPTGDAVQEFCNVPGNAPTVGNLVASGNNNWYLTSSFGIPLDLSTPLVNGQSYYATTIDPPCESSDRLEVLVNIYEPNDAGTNGNNSICVNNIPSTVPFDLFNLLGGTPNTTGVWTGPIATSNGFQGTLDVSTMTLAGSPYTFTYTVSSALCATAQSTVTITILPLPTVAISVNTTVVCSGNSATITFTGTPNATVTYTVNSGSNQTIVLNGSGTATISTIYTLSTTYALVSVASSGSPSCSQLQSGSVTINVLPLPTASAAFSPAPICANTSSTLTFTGTPNATVTYTINGGSNQTIVLNGTGTATLVGTYIVNTTVVLVSVASASTPVCTQPLGTSVTLTVIDPTATATFSPTTICANTSSTLTFTGTPNATVTYTINGGSNQTIVLNGAGTATLAGTYTVNTTVVLVSVTTAGSPTCTKLLGTTIILTVIDPTATAAFNPTTICANTSSTLTFTGTPNATVTYTINGGSNQTIVLNGAGTATLGGTYTVNTTVVLVSVTTAGSPGCTKLLGTAITLTVIDPTATAAFNPSTICSNTSSTLTFTGTPNATVTYTINGGSNQTIVLNGAGTATLVGTYTVNTTIVLVSVATTSPSCSKLLGTIITLTVIDPIATAAFNPTTICANTSSTLTFTGTPNATVTYTINGGSNQTIVLNGTGTATLAGTYTVNTTVVLVSVTTAGSPSCTKLLGTTITLTVIDPTATAVFNPTTICSNTSSTLTFTGTPNATVTYTINGGSNQTIVLNGAGTATLVGTYTVNTTVVLVSVTTAGSPSCTKLLGTTIILTVLDPTATAAFNPTTICSNTSSTLTFTGTPNATVTYTINGGSNQTIVLDGAGTATLVGTYTVNTTVVLVSVTTAGSPSCTKLLGTTITLTVIDPIATAAFNPASICTNTSSTLTFTGTPNATVTYTINGGSNQTIVLNGTGTANIVGTYTLTTTVVLVSVTTAGSPSCTKLLGTIITLTVIDPTATAAFNPTTICSNTSSTLTFTGTPNATVTYTINGGSNQTIVLDGAGTATLVGTYTLTTTVVLVSVTTAGSPSCTKLLGTTITLTVIDATATAAFNPTTICANTSSILTFTGTPNATVTYTINGGSNQTIVLDGAGTATLVGTYTVNTTVVLVSVTTAGSPNCTKLLGTIITLTVIDPTATAAFNPTTICANTSSTLTFTGTPNATVTYTIDGGSDQTIVLDAAGTATLVGTYTLTTTVVLVSVTTAGSPSCTKLLGTIITLTVIDATAIAAFNPTTICANTSSTLTFTGTPNATVTYTINGGSNQTIVLDAAGTATLVGTYTVNTTVVLVSVTTAGSPSCTKLIGTIITLTVIDPTATATFAPATICANTSSTLTFTGSPNATVTYTIDGGSDQTIVLDGAGTATLVGTYTLTTTVVLVSVTTAGSPSCTKLLGTIITLTVIDPTATATFNPTTICANTSSTLTFTGTPNATVTYTINGGSNQTIVLNGSGIAAITTTNLITTTVTLVSVTTAGSPSCTKLLGTIITLTVIDATATASFAPATICANTSSTLTFTGTPNATVTYTINGGSNQTIVLDGTGTATLVGTYTVNTTVVLVNVTTAGSPSCTKLLGTNITLTVIDPIATAAFAPATICANASSTLTFSGTPNATVTYTIDGGSDQTIVLDGAGTATLVGTYTITTTVVLVSVTTAGSPSCTKLLGTIITLTVIQLPTVSIASSTTICSGDSATVAFTGTPNATVTYIINGGSNQTIVLDASGAATITNTYLVDATFTLISAATSGTPSCSNPQSGSVLITVLPLPVVTIASNFSSVCENGQATVTFTGTADATVTYTVNGGGNQTIVLDAAGIATIISNYSVTTTYTLVSITSSGAQPCTKPLTDTITITVIPFPTVTIASNTTLVCAGDSVTVTFTGSPNATVTYTINGGSNQTIVLSALGTATIVSTYAVTTTYTLVSIATATTPSCSQLQNGSVVINVSQPAVAGVSTSQAFCSSSPALDLFTLLGNTAQLGGIWTPTMASGTGVFDPAVDAAVLYTYIVTGTSPCPDSQATVNVTVNPVPDAGTGGTVPICSNANPINLFASLTGTPQSGGTWSPPLASGTGIFNPAVDVAGDYDYTITGIAPCADAVATITVNITAGPEAGQNGNVTLCLNSATEDLFTHLGVTAQAGGTWTPALASGTGVFDPAVDAETTYSYAFSGPQTCDNDSATVTVTVNPIPDAGIGNPKEFCSNDAPQDLFASLTGTPQTGGIWTPALASGTGVFNPAVDSANSYTYTVGGGLCTTSTATVVVTVTQAPNAGGVGQTLTTCANVTSIDLFTGLDGTQGVGTWADDNSSGALTGNIFNPTTPGAGTYHFTYTVTGGTSPCVSNTATVTVVVNPLPNAGLFTGIQSVCPSAGVFDLNTLLSGQQAGGTWTDNANAVVTSPITIINFAPATYSYTYTVTSTNNTCGFDARIVQFTVLPNPQLTSAEVTTTPICLGSGETVNLSGMTDGTYTINYDLNGNNTLPNQFAVVTIVAGVGSFTIPAASIPNVGITVINFTTIQNNTSTCGVTLVGVAKNFVINPLADLIDTNLSATNVCFGNSITVNIAGATSLPDGVYVFNYTIPTGTPTIGNSGNVTITGGVGQFTIPASTFASAAIYSLTVTGITTTTGCSNPTENATVNFELLALPNVTGATLAAQSTCVNFTSEVTISNATNLVDGTYVITYQLTGANAATTTINVTFVGGVGSFTIPSTDLANAGDTTVTINQIDSPITLCGVAGTSFIPFSFAVTTLGTPVLLPNGNLFCEANSPTVANLSSNISGTETVVWYNADTGGTAYNPTDLLVNGTTYYATFVAGSGCESPTRLHVTVDLTVCADLVIPDGFSPNNDGINDEFVIANLPILYPYFRLQIFNRYGSLVYVGRINSQNWNGTSSEGNLNLGNGVLPTGVYFYVLEFNDGTRKPVQGRLYLNR